MIRQLHLQERRRVILQQMGKGVALLLGRPRTSEDNLALYPKKQHSDFFYLTGVEAPDAVALISTTRPHFTLFLEEPNCKREIWTGPMMTFTQAKREFGANVVLPTVELEKQCVEVFGQHDTIWYTLGSSERGDALVKQTLAKLKHSVRDGVRAPTTVRDLAATIAELRLRKSREELAAMRKAQTITAEAFAAAMKSAKPGRYEYEILAELEAVFRRRGVVRPAYQPIICSGPKTYILHCPTYDRRMRAGDLLLLDAGAQWDGYCADVTRTIPVSGKFTKAQRLIYDIVLEAQKAVIANVRPGTRWDELERTARVVLSEGLIKHKVIEARPRSNQCFPHKIGHWIGLDAHDVGSYREPDGKRWRQLEPGMVLTVEPGLYFPKDTKGVAREFIGIGIRIEDDVLVTKNNSVLLSEAVPK
jgi:Xaa-Pro aminopeptidase